MSSTSLLDLTPDTRGQVRRLIALASDSGIRLGVVSTLRTCDEQNKLFEIGRSAPGEVVTADQGCRSWHLFGRAVDLVILDGDTEAPDDDPRYAELGAIAEKLGFVWGGNWNDPTHFEYHPGLDIEGICPDPRDCDMSVGRFGAQHDFAPYEDETETESNIARIVVSAVVGAVVFQVVAFAFREVTKP